MRRLAALGAAEPPQPPDARVAHEEEAVAVHVGAVSVRRGRAGRRATVARQRRRARARFRRGHALGRHREPRVEHEQVVVPEVLRRRFFFVRGVGIRRVGRHVGFDRGFRRRTSLFPVAFAVLVEVRLDAALERVHLGVPLFLEDRGVHVAPDAARAVHHDRRGLIHPRERARALLHVRLHGLPEALLHRPSRAAEVTHVPLVPVPNVQQHRCCGGLFLLPKIPRVVVARQIRIRIRIRICRIVRSRGVSVELLVEHLVPLLRAQRRPAPARVVQGEVRGPALELHDHGLVPERELRVRVFARRVDGNTHAPERLARFDPPRVRLAVLASAGHLRVDALLVDVDAPADLQAVLLDERVVRRHLRVVVGDGRELEERDELGCV